MELTQFSFRNTYAKAKEVFQSNCVLKNQFFLHQCVCQDPNHNSKIKLTQVGLARESSLSSDNFFTACIDTRMHCRPPEPKVQGVNADYVLAMYE